MTHIIPPSILRLRTFNTLLILGLVFGMFPFHLALPGPLPDLGPRTVFAHNQDKNMVRTGDGVQRNLAAALAPDGDPAVQIYYVPFPEQQIFDALTDIAEDSTITDNVNGNVHSVVSIVAGFDGTVVYYDHWEDGYEADIANPVQATTEIWGDADGPLFTNGDINNPHYGGAAGCTTGCTGDTFDKGDVISLENDIPVNPRSPATLFYDGRDKIGVTRAVAVTRASWVENPAALLAGAVEVYPASAFDISFETPVGENTGSATITGTPYNITAPQIFEYVSLFIQASEDGTALSIDKDGDGTNDLTGIILNEGEVYWMPGNTGGLPGAYVGATVTSSAPVQVDVLTANKSYEQKPIPFSSTYLVDATPERYDSRWFSLFPTSLWADSYYSPVGKNDLTDKVHVYLYNPGGSAISVDYETLTGSGTLSVPAGGLTEFTMPSNSGAHFSSPGNVFYAISTVDSDGSGDGTDGTTTTHDWGFPLIPNTSLTSVARVGWAPGSEDLSANYSPVWVTAVADTRLYIDYDGDGIGPLTDPQGNQYDAHYDIATLESYDIYDLSDNDQTGMNIYTLDGVLITAAYGQDPATAVGGYPAIDVGTTVLPFPQVLTRKDAELYADNQPVGGNGLYDPGDIVEFTIVVDNHGETPLYNVVVSDILPTDTTYMANSTYVDGVLQADDGAGTTNFPLDEGGITIASIPLDAMVEVTFRVLINLDWPLDKDSITNIATIIAADETFHPEVTVPVEPPNNDACAAGFLQSIPGGLPALYFPENGMIYLQLADSDANTTAGVDSVSVIVTNLSNGDVETVGLNETGGLSGIFEGSIASSTSGGLSSGDGTVNASAVDTLELSYQDPTYLFDTCSDTIRIDPPLQIKSLYLTEPQDLDRVDPVGSGDVTTSRSITVTGGTNPPLYVCYDTTTVYATQATWIQEDSDGNDNHDGSDLEVKDDTNEPKDRHTLVQFDLPALPAGAQIVSADLGMFIATAKDTLSVLIKRATASWNETTVTWNTRPTATGAYGFFTPAPSGVYVDHDVTSLVQGWADGSFANHGIVLEGNSENDGDTAKFSDEDVAGEAPRLLIGYEYTYPGGCLQSTRIYLSDGVAGADTHIDESNTASNYGSDNRLLIDSRSGQRNHTLLKFDVSAIPSGSAVVHATFAIDLQTAKNNTSSIYEMTTIWTETGATWNDPDGAGGSNGWNGSGGGFGASDYDSANLLGTINNNQATNAFYAIDETSATGARNLADVVEDWVAGANKGLVLLASGNSDGDAKYYSQEEGDSTRHPYLDVTFVSPTGTLTRIASQDAFIDEDQPANNYNVTEMKVKNDVGGDQNRSVLVDFDLSSGIPSGATITGATFNIYVTSANTEQTVTIRALENAWLESEVTYNERLIGTAWDTAGGDYSGSYGSFTPTPQAAYVSTNLDTLAQAWGNGTIGNFGLILDPDSAADTESRYSSREVAGKEPYLTLTYEAAALESSTTIAYTQTLAMASDLGIPAGQSITVTNYVEMAAGSAMTETLEITATLKHGGNTFATLTSPTVNPNPCSGICILQWTGVVATDVIIPEGEQIIFEHTNSEDNSQYKILFDSASYPSRIDLPTYDVIDVYDIGAYDAAYPGGTWVTTVAAGETVYLRSTVIDPFGASDITSATLTITDTGGSPATVTPTVVNTSAGAKTFEYAWTAPAAECGLFSLSLTAWEGYEGITDTATGSIEVNDCAVLLIDKDTGTPTVYLGGQAVYTIVVSNVGGIASGVRISDTLPTSFTYASTNAIDSSGIVTRTSTLGPAAAATTPVWGEWDMASGSAITITFVADVDVAATPGIYDNDAFAAANNHALIDDIGTLEGDPDTLPTDTPESDEDVLVIPGSGAIGDYVWHDENQDGIQDVEESGLANVVVELWRDEDMNGSHNPITDTLVASTTTDTNGGYLFSALLPGDYIVHVDESSAALAGMALTSGPQSQTNPSPAITSTGDNTYRDADFGYALMASGSTAIIGDTLFYDANGNGVQDPGELGIPGASVIITGSNLITYTAITDGNGIYHVEVPADGATTYTAAPDPASNALIALTPTSPTPHAIPALAPGAPYLDADFGYEGPALGHIDGLVFIDVGNDGVYNAPGDSIIAAVSVQLVRDDNGNGMLDGGDTIVSTRVTDSAVDANGNNYSFDGLPPDTYFVRVSDTLNVLKRFLQASLGAPGVDNNSQNQPYAVALSAGEEVLSADFGYAQGEVTGAGDPTGLIGNQIWHDVDGDGVYEPGSGETGIAGVTVELWSDVDGDGVLSPIIDTLYAETASGASGNYMFLDVPAGAYLVQVSDDANVLAGYLATLGSNPGADNNSQEQAYAMTLPMGGFNFTADFGYALPVSIGDFIFQDFNGDGLQQGSETVGINSVVISATNLSTLATATTISMDGAYLFTNLLPGTYRISVSQYVPGLTLTSPSPLDLTLSSGESYLLADFGYIAPTAVALASFEAVTGADSVTLHWRTSSEQNQEGFVVWRAPAAEGPYKAVSGLIPAQNSPDGAEYKWRDEGASVEGSFWYRLESRPDGEMFGPIPSRDDPGEGGASRLFTPLVLR